MSASLFSINSGDVPIGEGESFAQRILGAGAACVAAEPGCGRVSASVCRGKR